MIAFKVKQGGICPESNEEQNDQLAMRDPTPEFQLRIGLELLNIA